MTFSSRVHGREEEEKTKSHHLVTKVLFFLFGNTFSEPYRAADFFFNKTST